MPGPGDPDGSGTVFLTINPGQEDCLQIGVQDIRGVTVTHIHCGSASEAGPVVVPVVSPARQSLTNCGDLGRELTKAIMKNPQAFYVNAGDPEFPRGALRGQLSK